MKSFLDESSLKCYPLGKHSMVILSNSPLSCSSQHDIVVDIDEMKCNQGSYGNFFVWLIAYLHHVTLVTVNEI